MCRITATHPHAPALSAVIGGALASTLGMFSFIFSAVMPLQAL